MITRLAGRLVADHPLLPKKSPAATSFVHAFQSRRIMLGHVANVPDSYWRTYDKDLREAVSALGDSTHHLNRDKCGEKIPLAYAKGTFGLGTLPWRAQQFYDLYVWFLKNAAPNTPARDALTFAGLMSHFTGDVSMPLHASSNFDGEQTDQKGVHWYFESDLVDALEFQGLEKKVLDRALSLLTPLGPTEPHAVATLRTRAREMYPESEKKNEVAALMLILLQDSLEESNKLLKLDKENGKRSPEETMAVFEPMIVERLAISVALTTDIWVRGWLDAGSPEQNYTWDYAHKPAFVSPTDPQCFGYVINEKIKSKKGKPISDTKLLAKDHRSCLKL